MRDWLLHMTEDQRTYAAGLIDAMLVSLRTLAYVPVARSSDWARLIVGRLPDRKSGAGVTLSRGTVTLRTPLSLRRRMFAAELVGPAFPPIDVLRDGDVAVILVTLVRWRTALASKVTDATMADAAETARASTLLLRGAAHAHRPDWEMATLQTSREEGHVVRVFHRTPEGRQIGRRFVGRSAGRNDGGMTEALAAEIGRIVGNRHHAHVVELNASGRFLLRFDATPEYALAGIADPMLTLRALNALPSGARLVACE